MTDLLLRRQREGGRKSAGPNYLATSWRVATVTEAHLLFSLRVWTHADTACFMLTNIIQYPFAWQRISLSIARPSGKWGELSWLLHELKSHWQQPVLINSVHSDSKFRFITRLQSITSKADWNIKCKSYKVSYFPWLWTGNACPVLFLPSIHILCITPVICAHLLLP